MPGSMLYIFVGHASFFPPGFFFVLPQAGADIVPVYFFGNSLLHDLVGGEGADNWLFKLSRKVVNKKCFFWCKLRLALSP